MKEFKLKEKVFGALEEKMKNGSNNSPIGVFLEGGHFDPRYGSTEFSISSLNDSISLGEQMIKEYKNRIKVVFGILVDDLGIDCSDNGACSIEESKNILDLKKIPEDLENILSQSKYVKRDKVAVMGEINAKNRGIKTIKNILTGKIENKEELIFIENKGGSNNIYFQSDDGSKVLIGEHKGNNIWVAKCPIIMGQHYSDVFNLLMKRFPEIGDKMIIDFSEFSDVNKVMKGTEIALRSFNIMNEKSNQIMNVFYMDSKGDQSKLYNTLADDFE